jgi:hypothetical protein
MEYGPYLIEIKLGINIKTSKSHIMVANIRKILRKMYRQRKIYLESTNITTNITNRIIKYKSKKKNAILTKFIIQKVIFPSYEQYYLHRI